MDELTVRKNIKLCEALKIYNQASPYNVKKIDKAQQSFEDILRKKYLEKNVTK